MTDEPTTDDATETETETETGALLTDAGRDRLAATEHHEAVAGADVPDSHEPVAYTIDPTESKDPEYGRRVDVISAGKRPKVGVRADDAKLYECQRCGHLEGAFGLAGDRVKSANTRKGCPECGMVHDDWRLIAVRTVEDSTDKNADEDADADGDGDRETDGEEPEVVTDGGVDVDEDDEDDEDDEGGDRNNGHRSTIIARLEALAGEGRIPVSDHGHRDDPALNIQTPAGVVRSSRRPDGAKTEGSAHQRWWTWATPGGGPSYRLVEERDGHPDLDAEDRHAVVVRESGGPGGE